jgi:RNA polymerase sigma factor (sigma-70 family)
MKDFDVRDHTGWVSKRARRISNGDEDLFEDLFQEGMAYLLEKAKSYDPSKGYTFLSYIAASLDGHLYSYARKLRTVTSFTDYAMRDKKDLEEERVAFDSWLVDRNECDDTLESNVLEDMDAERVYKIAKEVLRENEYKVFVYYFKHGMTFTTIGKKFGFSRQRATELFTNAVSKIRRRL